MGPVEKRELALLLEASCGYPMDLVIIDGRVSGPAAELFARGWVNDAGLITEAGRRRVRMVEIAVECHDAVTNELRPQRELPLAGSDASDGG